MSNDIKLPWWVWAVIILTALFIIVQMFIKAYVKDGVSNPLGVDRTAYLDKLKDLISKNFIIRKKVCEDVDGEKKLKKDLETKIEDIFNKYK